MDQHREVFAAMEWEGYCKRFEVSELMLKKFVAKAEQAGIPYDKQAFLATKRRMKRLSKHTWLVTYGEHKASSPSIIKMGRSFRKH